MREKGHNKTEGDSKKQKTEEAEAETEAALPKPVFRSYKPKDENLQVGFCRFRIRLCLFVLSSVRPILFGSKNEKATLRISSFQKTIMAPAKPGDVTEKVQEQMEAGKSEVRSNFINLHSSSPSSPSSPFSPFVFLTLFPTVENQPIRLTCHCLFLLPGSPFGSGLDVFGPTEAGLGFEERFGEETGKVGAKDSESDRRTHSRETQRERRKGSRSGHGRRYLGCLG